MVKFCWHLLILANVRSLSLFPLLFLCLQIAVGRRRSLSMQSIRSETHPRSTWELVTIFKIRWRSASQNSIHSRMAAILKTCRESVRSQITGCGSGFWSLGCSYGTGFRGEVTRVVRLKETCAVVDFGAAKASKNIKAQQRSIGVWQAIRNKTVAVLKIPQISIMA
jgi:hypothetical protein